MTEPSEREIRLRVIEAVAKHCTAEMFHNIDSVEKIASRLESYVINSTPSVPEAPAVKAVAKGAKSKKTDTSVDPFD